MDVDHKLQDCSEMDQQSSVGSCDLVKDYRRLSHNRSNKSPIGHNG